MDYFIPYYVNERQSGIRGITVGWYTMDECGKLGSGPFSSACECLECGCRRQPTPAPRWLH